MKILFLDDDKVRCEWILKELSGSFYNLTIVNDVKSCIQKLDNEQFDIVCLDHDLGGKVFVDSGEEETGMEVVRWIERRDGNIDVNLFIVHSWNGPAARDMNARLNESGYKSHSIPFGNGLVKKLKAQI